MSLNKPIYKLKNWINKDKLEYDLLCCFTKSIQLINENLYEELIKEVMRPSRVFKNPDYDYIKELF